MGAPKRLTDVHMAVDGANMACSACHKTEKHAIPGKALSVSATGGGTTLDCSDCHAGTPHPKNATLNRHAGKVACQTCHIPIFARALPTKVSWDWSTAGKGAPGEKDQYGLPIYDKQKGDFKWEKDVKPVYRWFNGSGDRYLLGDKMDPAKVTHLSSPRGDRNDKAAKLTPFKIMQGKQPYDSVNNVLAVPNLWGGYWGTGTGTSHCRRHESGGLEYSGQYGFAPTDMYWKVNHMVVPKAQALKCNDCHAKDGRMDWAALGYAGDPRPGKK